MGLSGVTRMEGPLSRAGFRCSASGPGAAEKDLRAGGTLGHPGRRHLKNSLSGLGARWEAPFPDLSCTESGTSECTNAQHSVRTVFPTTKYLRHNKRLPDSERTVFQNTGVMHTSDSSGFLYSKVKQAQQTELKRPMSPELASSPKGLKANLHFRESIITTRERMNCFSKHVSQENADQRGTWLSHPLCAGEPRGRGKSPEQREPLEDGPPPGPGRGPCRKDGSSAAAPWPGQAAAHGHPRLQEEVMWTPAHSRPSPVTDVLPSLTHGAR